MNKQASVILTGILLAVLLVKGLFMLMQFLIAHPLVWQLLMLGAATFLLKAAIIYLPDYWQAYQHERVQLRWERARKELQQQARNVQADQQLLRQRYEYLQQYRQDLIEKFIPLAGGNPGRRAAHEHRLQEISATLGLLQQQQRIASAREQSIREALAEFAYLDRLRQPPQLTGKLSDDSRAAAQREQLLIEAEREAEQALDELLRSLPPADYRELPPRDLV